MPVASASSPARYPARLSPISWPAIFASLAVAVSVMLLLTLAGVAFGVSSVEHRSDIATLTLGAAAWQTVSMLVAAVVGGYVAARLSGLRRTADGVLHGAVSWGATTVMYAALATTALGSLTAGMFGVLAPAPEPMAAGSAITIADRAEAQRTLEAVGLAPDQARLVIDRLGEGSAPPATAEEIANTVGTATMWLSATVLLSLALSLAGGAFGARGVRRGNMHFDYGEPPPDASHLRNA